MFPLFMLFVVVVVVSVAAALTADATAVEHRVPAMK
jgi:hypothetical protein